MKQRITAEDILSLSEDKKQAINDMWIPAIYDAAVALVCTDVEEEKYEAVEFVVGGIHIYNRTSMILHDLKYIPDGKEAEAAADDSGSTLSEENESDLDEDTDEESDIDFSYSRPTAFNKEDCLPLLTVGQMIEFIQKKGFGYGDFYLAAGINDVGCEIGKAYFDINNYGTEFERKELCEVLWEYLKMILD